MDFKKLTTTKLGTLAEEMIIREFAQAKQSFPFIPGVDGSHPIDSLMITKGKIWGMDVKCKSSRIYHPDTGFDLNDFEQYKTYDFPVYILWIDIRMKKIYGNWISKLNKNKTIEGKYIYFPLSKMQEYRDLTEAEYNALKTNENSSYN